MRFCDQDVWLEEGEMIIVPKTEFRRNLINKIGIIWN
jgi:hypothetical protein